MTTFEEKNRLGSQGFWQTMSGILNAVVVAPEGFNSEDMTLFDFHFLMYKMRTVSYGPTYKVNVTCPHCGKSFDNAKMMIFPHIERYLKNCDPNIKILLDYCTDMCINANDFFGFACADDEEFDCAPS